MMILYFYAVGILLAGLINTFFAFAVYLKNKRNFSNIIYALLSLAFAVWCYSWFAMLLVKDNRDVALFLARLLNFGAVFIPAFYFHWIISILGLEKENRKNIIANYSMTVIFAVASWTPFFVEDVHSILFFPYWPTAGFLYIFYLIFGYFIFSAYGIYLLLKNLFITYKGDKIKSNQIKYVILGSLMGFGGGALNFFLMYNINPFGQFADIGVFIFLALFIPFAIPLAYATMKYHLMDIRFVFVEMLASLLTVTLLVDIIFSIFTSVNFLIILFKFSVFIVFGCFAAMLIGSFLKEIKNKEEIERMAKDVQRAYEIEKRAKEQTERAYELEKKANEELKMVDEAKSQFMAITQHHLRTPLTSMMGYLDLLLANNYGKISVKVKDILKRLEVSTQNEIKIVNELLNVSEFQLGKGAIQSNPEVSIKEILEDVVKDLVLESEKKGLYLRIEEQKNLSIPLITADKNKLKMAITNIVDNAVKYTQKGGILIKVKSKDKKLIIEITDTGIGMTKQESQTLFGKTFQRGEEAKKLFVTGKGIGLFLSAKIIEAHKGKIWAESQGQGKGSTFFIELPANN